MRLPKAQLPDLILHKFHAARLAGYQVYARPLSQYLEGQAPHTGWSPEDCSDLAWRLAVDALIDLHPCTDGVYAARGQVTVYLKYADFPGNDLYDVSRMAVLKAASQFQQSLDNAN